MKIIWKNKEYELTNNFEIIGDENVIELFNFKFQILFDYGVLAFLDGYYRESISSIIASLERFFEAIIKNISLESQIEEKDFIKTWKFIKKQSERQIGAFFFLYLLKMKKPQENILDKTMDSTGKSISNFRNEVIHNGYIPTREETEEFIRKVFDYITTTIQVLHDNTEEKFRLRYLNKKSTQTIDINTMIKSTPETQNNYHDALDTLKRIRVHLHKNA